MKGMRSVVMTKKGVQATLTNLRRANYDVEKATLGYRVTGDPDGQEPREVFVALRTSNGYIVRYEEGLLEPEVPQQPSTGVEAVRQQPSTDWLPPGGGEEEGNVDSEGTEQAAEGGQAGMGWGVTDATARLIAEENAQFRR